MFRRLATAAAAAVLLTGAASAPARAQVAQLPAPVAEQAARNVAVTTEVNARVAELVTSLDQSGVAQATSMESYVAAIDGMAPQLTAARRELAGMQARLRALPELGGESGPVQLRSIDRVVDDSINFVRRVDAMLAAFPEVADGFRSNDPVKAERALGVLSSATMTLVDGQALMMRGRASLIGSDRSDYAHAEGIACLYDGLAAVMRLKLEIIEPPAAADLMQTARTCVKDQVQSGRAALVRESANRSPRPAARALEERMAEISERIFAKMDEGGDLLDDTQAVIKAGAPTDRLDVQIERFTVFERELSALGDEQGRNLIARSPG